MTVALVTGGNRGIGLACAQRLRESGHTVVVGCRSGIAPDGLFAVAMDVSDAESINAAFETIEEQHGPISVVVANAGITRDNLLMRMSDEDIDEVLATNLAGSIRIARRALRNMLKARSGRIILVSSVVGLMGSAGQVNYAASKAGLVGVARSLAREVDDADLVGVDDAGAAHPVADDAFADFHVEVDDLSGDWLGGVLAEECAAVDERREEVADDGGCLP